MDWYAERNEKIYREWLEGSPVRDLAQRWQLERETILKIIVRIKGSSFFADRSSSTMTNNIHNATKPAPVSGVKK